MTAAVFGLAAGLAAILPWALLVGVCLAVLMLGRGTTLLLVGDIDEPTRQRARRPMVVGLVTLVVLVLMTFGLNGLAATFAGAAEPANLLRIPTGPAARLTLLGALIGGALWTWCELTISRRASRHDNRDRCSRTLDAGDGAAHADEARTGP